MLAILPLILPLISSILGRLIPDAGQAAQVNAELQKALLERQGEIDRAIAEAAKAQADINLQEAQHPSRFVSGWRPFVGWVCGLGCAYGFIVQPFLTWFATLGGVATPPTLDMSTLMGLLGGLLGLGSLRTVEKIKDVARK
jgi:holin (3TMs family)